MKYYIVLQAKHGCPPIFHAISESVQTLEAVTENYFEGFYINIETTKEVHDKMKQLMVQSLS